MQERKYNELGSEFWLQDIQTECETYALSGRTAIDLIIRDMMATGKPCKSVYMPAWCCDSMLQPFIDRGVAIQFYDVSIAENGLSCHVDENTDADILYVTNYFGYNSTLSTDVIEQFKLKECSVIYDRTHSLFRYEDDYIAIADYTFASIRKWLGVPCGAMLSKKEGQLALPKMKDCSYINNKVEAMTLKATYMEQPKEDLKPIFLDLYGRFGHQLAEDYRDYKMDELSQNIWQYADKQALMKSRCANAVLLQVCLKEILHIHQLFTFVKGDCPLFVPVLLDSKEERDALRKHLTAHAVYCPVHWPKPALIPDGMKANELYDHELSLLCDQRYGLDDMHHIVNTIKEFYQ